MSRQTNNQQQTEEHSVEVLSFVRGDNLATIATDGRRHVSQEFEHCQDHPTLTKAISYLLAKGYSIDPSNFRNL